MRNRSIDAMKVARIMLLLGICTASADIGLTLNIAGFNARILYLYILFAFVIVMYAIARSKILIKPYAIGWIGIWVLLNIMYVGNSIILLRGVLYIVVLLVSLTLLFCTVEAFRAPSQQRLLMKWYIIGFVAHALLGLFQWILYKGLGLNVVSQELGGIGRINGLTHEPSAFAGYEVIGYVLLRELIQRRANYFSVSSMRYMLGVVAIALVLSTSKTAWLFMLLYEFITVCRVLLNAILTRRLTKNIVMGLSIFIFTVGGLGFYAVTNSDSPLIQKLLSGSGVAGSASHSVDDRLERTLLTVQAAEEHPFAGLSYGGIAPYIHLKVNNFLPESNADIIVGMFTPAEIWAASGLPGFIIWLIYIGSMCFRYRHFPEGLKRSSLISMSFAFLFGLGALTSDFTRATIWAHLAVWSALALSEGSAKKSKKIVLTGGLNWPKKLPLTLNS